MKLSKLTEQSTPNDAINAPNKATDTAANANHIELYDAGQGHGQGWRFKTNNQVVASGSIPQTSHGAKNLQKALGILIDAVQTHGIAD
jgi:hypothetical protein